MNRHRFFGPGAALLSLVVVLGHASVAGYAAGAIHLDPGEEPPPPSDELVGDLPLPELPFLMIFKVREKGGDLVLRALKKAAGTDGIRCFTIYIKALNDPKWVKGDDPVKPEISGVNCESPYRFVASPERTDKGQMFPDGNVFVIVDTLGCSDAAALKRISRTLDTLAAAMRGNRDVQLLCRTSKVHPDDKCKLEHAP